MLVPLFGPVMNVMSYGPFHDAASAAAGGTRHNAVPSDAAASTTKPLTLCRVMSPSVAERRFTSLNFTTSTTQQEAENGFPATNVAGTDDHGEPSVTGAQYNAAKQASCRDDLVRMLDGGFRSSTSTRWGYCNRNGANERLPMGDVAKRLTEIVGDKNVLTGDAISEDYTHDEALTATPQKPAYVVKPAPTFTVGTSM